ncbi:MAG: hypothetical protein F6K30_06145 [Cyanothece sp. SIO2G6]|nr:hypothetical protein [Cyanothece sp. SIO2G6]
MNTSLCLGSPTQDSASYQNSFMHCTDTNVSIKTNDRALKTLARSITLSKNRFSLTFVRCDRSYPKHHILDLLRDRHNLVPAVLNIPVEAKRLYPITQNYWDTCDKNYVSALFILGLEDVAHLDELLVSTNQDRNEFRHHFACPLVIWIDDEITQKLIKLAPDFYNWASIPIYLG